jgi:hypothetical protein
MFYSGIELHKTYPDRKFYKLTNETEIHNDYQFHTGLNIDPVKFDTSEIACSGGMYFTDSENMGRWCMYGETICQYFREVKLPDDANIVYFIEYGKYKTDKFYLSERQVLWTSKEMCKNITRYSTTILKRLPFQTLELCDAALELTPQSLRLIKNKTISQCEKAVSNCGYTLEYIPVTQRTNELCELAVAQNGCALQFVPIKTRKICKIAILQNSKSIRWVPTILAERCLKYINEPIEDAFHGSLDFLPYKNKF